MNARYFTIRGAACALFACILCAAAPSRAASPGFGGVTPSGAQRGTEVEVQFNGDRFGDAQQILFYEPGITVAHLEAAGANAIKTKLVIAPDCRLGLHQMPDSHGRLALAICVPSASAPCRKSKRSSPTTISPSRKRSTLDTTVNGVVDNEDVDYFAVEAKKGERITAEIEGLRLGITFFDPYVAILDTKRFELARSDDAPLLRQDCVCSIVAPDDGTYIIQVRETSFARQRLVSVPTARRPLSAADGRVSLGRQARRNARRAMAGRRARAREARRSRCRRQFRRCLVFSPATNGASRRRPIPFRLVDLNNVLEVEPNNGFAGSNRVRSPGRDERRDFASPATSTSSSFRPRRGRFSTFACWPALMARRSIRCSTSIASAARRSVAMMTAAGRTVSCVSPCPRTTRMWWSCRII